MNKFQAGSLFYHILFPHFLFITSVYSDYLYKFIHFFLTFISQDIFFHSIPSVFQYFLQLIFQINSFLSKFLHIQITFLSIII
jgi:hypothetical protein